MEIKDEQLILLIQRGESSHFETIYLKYKPLMMVYVNRLTNNYQYSEDIVQEIFCKVYQNIHKFDCDRKFKSWIYRIAHNHAISVIYKESKKNFCTTSIDEDECLIQLEDKETRIDELIALTEKNQDLFNALMLIKKRHSDILIDYYYKDKDYKTIANEWGISVNTVGILLSRGKQELAKYQMFH